MTKKVPAPKGQIRKKPIKVGVTLERYAAIEALAARAGVSMSWLGERAFMELLDRYSKDGAQLPFTFAESRQAAE